MGQQLTIRFSESADLPAVLNFYQANQHPHVDFRGEDIFADRVNNGRAIIVEKPDGDLGLVSMAHPLGTDSEWTEIGSTLANLGGFSLYPFIIASQVVHEFLTTPPKQAFFACVYKDNQIVTNMLHKKVGWKFMDASVDFARAAGETAESMKKINWLTADSQTIPHQARVVTDLLDRGYAENRKTGEKLPLDVSRFSLAQGLRSTVDALARGPVGQYIEMSGIAGLAATKRMMDGPSGWLAGSRPSAPRP